MKSEFKKCIYCEYVLPIVTNYLNGTVCTVHPDVAQREDDLCVIVKPVNCTACKLIRYKKCSTCINNDSCEKITDNVTDCLEWENA